MFTEKDIQLIESKGLTVEQVNKQLSYFEQGFPYAEIVEPAIIDRGITRFSAEDALSYSRKYESFKSGKRIIKFVPASGAASRMFQVLFAYLDQKGSTGASEEILKFILNLDDFAFREKLVDFFLADEESLDNLVQDKQYGRIIRSLLMDEGLGYGNLPKALLPFHKYPSGTRTAAEEHLAEGAMYAAQSDGKVRVHFTLSPEHILPFTRLMMEVVPAFETRFKVSFDISHSIQKSSTDLIAVDSKNKPFRDLDGSLVFRPGGHGALLDNLGELEADLVFIKNIDNVVPDRLKPETVLYKKALAGILLDTREKAYGYYLALRQGTATEETFASLVQFFKSRLGIEIPEGVLQLDHDALVDYYLAKLRRPFRVCGMVKNQSEPGGGPFWVKTSTGELSLQVLEASQIDFSRQDQVEKFKQASHFNPVDIVCVTRDFEGNRLNLNNFRNPLTGFISEKSKDGKVLKAQELPGLWNGSMADWNTTFVEVPLITFNPVKSVMDLLRPEHREG